MVKKKGWFVREFSLKLGLILDFHVIDYGIELTSNKLNTSQDI